MIGLEKIFSDNMVLQRRQPVKVWGTCGKASSIEVSLGDKSCLAQVENGSFVAWLPSMEAAEHLTLTITEKTADGNTEICEIQNVAVGEVWIAAGQSNMEYPLKYTAEYQMMKAMEEDDLLRFFDVPKISYEGQEKDRSYEDVGFWASYGHEAMDNFSAIGLMFAQKLRKELDVPIGIIGCNWGATSASSWMSREYLEEYPQLQVYLEDYEKAVRGLDVEWYTQTFLEKQAWGLTPRMMELNDKLNKGELDMTEMMLNFPKLPKRQQEYFMLQIGPMDQRRPCVLYETMVQRIMGYGVKGVIWYQGEADEVHPESYALLFSQLLKCWRKGWGQKLPFLTVQLAPFGHWMASTGKIFPQLRAQQERAAAVLDEVWLASIMDAGMETDIHPKTKKAAAQRLALLALGKLYGKPVLCDAPQQADVCWEENQIRVYMSHAGNGLYCTGQDIPVGLELLGDGQPLAFTAEVQGNKIILHTENLSCYTHVQLDYAQQPYVEANLYNSAGLCAKPFRTVRPWKWNEEE